MFEQIRNIVCDQLGLDETDVSPESRFIEDLHCDSLDVIELSVSIQDEYELPDIPENELVNFLTVGDLVKYVEVNAK